MSESLEPRILALEEDVAALQTSVATLETAVADLQNAATAPEPDVSALAAELARITMIAHDGNPNAGYLPKPASEPEA
jgi:uncharacterized coiled-coil protein SlyX